MEEFQKCDQKSENLEYTVIKSKTYSSFHTLIAITLWLGALHLNLVITALVFLFFPLKYAVLYIGKYGPGYFPTTVLIEDIQSFDPNQAYVLAAEPHSIFPIGCLSLLNITGLMPLSKTKGLASNATFYPPLLRQVGTWTGLVPATKKNFVKYLEAGYSCIVIPGGVQEIFYMEHGSEVAYLKKRQGFVRIAIETGRPLVPIFCFGQTNVYNWWKPKGDLYTRIARAIRFAPLLYWGMFGTHIPYRRPMHVIVGRPIELKRNPNPSKEEVAEVHALFVSKLEQLCQRHKAAAGHADIQLRVI
ncbi:diacylglycerol O-acyltransferase 2D isoform X2 [Amborella trichopoda]|uniref:diacylglycerol O-acyltransferase 2D isoform X2 n=1 Tax=Amborella trichopoda TaxID=13333 RepID=UPI0009C136F2|nr:diacylglycerol O-acyltransferase 2D isoform X2 [Amborella trichopoda]|eukprot:XP_020519353.1 diacylglycerol O-acyltransferase 2D isoform X2 [Amborella trichopoda]